MTGVLVLAERNPLLLAKELATLDQLSGGRVELGIGVGWLREEFEALGVPWEGRGRRTDEYIEVLRALWASDHTSHHGDFLSFRPVSSNPKPLRSAVPIIVGGHSPAAARRAGRFGDGFFPGVSRVLVPARMLVEPSVGEATQEMGERVVTPLAQVRANHA